MQQLILWRGYRDVQVTSKLLEEGGTELAPLSTSSNPAVAIRFAVQNNCLLFPRIVTDNNLQRGTPENFGNVSRGG